MHPAIFRKRIEAREMMRDELLNAAETNAESLEILERIEEMMQAEHAEMETLWAERAQIELRRARMEPWVEQERAKGRPEHELTWGNCQRETGLVSQEEIDAHERWRNGPHCLEEQIYLDAGDEASNIREDHHFTTEEMIDAVMRRMGRPEFAGKDKREGAIAIMKRFGFPL
jgi:hypothetical protein